MTTCVPLAVEEARGDLAMLHEQLRSIMEALTRAAVADICRLVEDGYALLRLEVSRKQKENEDLKEKLDELEMVLAQGGGARVREERRAIGGKEPRNVWYNWPRIVTCHRVRRDSVVTHTACLLMRTWAGYDAPVSSIGMERISRV
ncbi:hypothetical protein GN956_G26273 [Arapaima gigas]